jgi:hypothetical protein
MLELKFYQNNFFVQYASKETQLITKLFIYYVNRVAQSV